jgi:hypothetical protein
LDNVAFAVSILGLPSTFPHIEPEESRMKRRFPAAADVHRIDAMKLPKSIARNIEHLRNAPSCDH